MGRKPKINKEKLAEGCCFKCKDGGSMRICDFRDCLKVYHPECVGKEEDFVNSEAKWSCGWHFCFMCQKTSKYRCFCCPAAVCGRCLCNAQFFLINETNGFCIHCATLAGLLEGVKNPDPVEETVDFNDGDTYECMFKLYWETTKKEQNINVEHVSKAMELFSKDINYNNDFYCNGNDEVPNNLSSSEDDDDEDCYNLDSDQATDAFKRKKRKRCWERNVKPRKKEFVGWGSKPLMDFLTAIGEDITQELSQFDVNNMIVRYCNEHSLFDPNKKTKKKVICDSRLQSLFGKKSVNKRRIYELLSAHFANAEQEEDSCGDEYNTGLWREDVHDVDKYNNGCNSKSVARKRRSQDVPERNHEPPPNEAVPKEAQSCFALIISQNIKLVYLKKSLVEQLLTKPETFDEKIIGSFVRVKSDPNDYLQRASHQLQLVTDVKRRSLVNGCTSTGILLQVSNRHQDIAISQLSDVDFSEEECEDLGKRMKDGLLRRLTTVELREKAKALHEDITKHEISIELAQLTIRIDQANVKGWRRELSEYLDRRSLLQTPSEQSRLLQKVPEIITDNAGELVCEDESTMAETETAVGSAPTPTRQRHCVPGVKSNGSLQCMNNEKDFQGFKSSFRIRPKSALAKSYHNGNDHNHQDGSTGDDGGIAKEETPTSRGSRSPHLHEQSVTAHQSQSHIATRAQTRDCYHNAVNNSPIRSTGGALLSGEERKEQPKVTTGRSLEQPAVAVGISDAINRVADYESNHEIARSHLNSSCIEFPSEQPTVVPGQRSNFQVQNKTVNAEPNTAGKQRAIPEVIILSDTDEDSENVDSSRWYFSHPLIKGVRRGPYPISALKEWSDNKTSDVELKFWRVGQSEEEAVNLSDVLRQYRKG